MSNFKAGRLIEPDPHGVAARRGGIMRLASRAGAFLCDAVCGGAGNYDRSLPMQNSNERRPLQSAVLPDGDIVRLVAGLYCPCGRVLRCDPEPMGDDFRLLCAGCHGDVLIYEL